MSLIRVGFIMCLTVVMGNSDLYAQSVVRGRQAPNVPELETRRSVLDALFVFRDHFNSGDYFAWVGDIDVALDFVKADVDPEKARAVPLNAQGKAFIDGLKMPEQANNNNAQNRPDQRKKIPKSLKGVDLDVALAVDAPTELQLPEGYVWAVRRAKPSNRKRKDVTTATSEYSMSERRIMTLQLQHLMLGLHPLAQLKFSSTKIQVQGEQATVDVDYAIVSPRERDLRAGTTTLVFSRIEQEWRLQGVKGFVEKLWARE